MSGRRIDDHSFWAGAKGALAVLPDGARMKGIESTEGAGALGTYEDTEEKVRSQQTVSVRKIKANAQKPGYRN